MALNSFQDVRNMLDAFVASHAASGDVNMGHAPHGTFWNNLNYHDFTTADVPGGVKDPTTGKVLPILKKGDSKNSNIIWALNGAAGTTFAPTHDGGTRRASDRCRHSSAGRPCPLPRSRNSPTGSTGAALSSRRPLSQYRATRRPPSIEWSDPGRGTSSRFESIRITQEGLVKE